MKDTRPIFKSDVTHWFFLLFRTGHRAGGLQVCWSVGTIGRSGECRESHHTTLHFDFNGNAALA